MSVPYWASQVALQVKNPSAKAEEVRDTGLINIFIIDDTDI